MEDNNLIGPLPNAITNIVNLTNLHFPINQVSGPIPPSIGNLVNLTGFQFNDNNLSGTIPASIASCANLEYFLAGDNNLSGALPSGLGSLPLIFVRLDQNNLSGAIPTEIGNISTLEFLWLSDNNLSGSIPANLGNLPVLENLWLSNNNFSGSIPENLGNATSLISLHLNNNNLSGSIPATIGNLTNLEWLGLSSNQLSGCIPEELQDICSHVIGGDISGNPGLFTQSWDDFCAFGEGMCCASTHPDKAALKTLYEATDGDNWLPMWDTTTCNVCTWDGVTCNGSNRVVGLNLAGFGLTGTIPNINLPSLINLNLENNQLSGAIPNFSLSALETLILTNNPLTGPIPNFSGLPNLKDVFILGTEVSGPMPPFSLLPNLRGLIIANNSGLTGQVPNLSNRPNLITVHLYNNALDGGIANITNSPLLAGLELYGNQLTGPIPAFNLPNVGLLFLDNNQLSGPLPNLTLPNLVSIRLNNNNLSGCFPMSYSAFCTKNYNFFNNPLLPWQGDFSQFCASQPQVGAPCDNSNTPGADEIQTDCSCDQSCPTYTATPSGTTTLCNGNSTDITFTFSDGTAPYDVTWTGGTLTGISNGHTESVSPTTTTTYTISSATDANGCTATPSGSVTITVIDVVNLGAITGSNNVCTNQSTNYSVSAVSGVTSYNWTVPPGASITSGQGTPNITINWNGASSGDVCVEAVNPCGTGAQSCRAVTVTPLPNPPDPITGEEAVCTGIALPYSISDVPDATNYNWTVPAGATILSGQGTTAVSIRWNTASTGNVCARAQNTCGNSAYTCLSVTSVAVPTNPVFLAGNFAPCESATLDYGVTPQAAFDDYLWTYDNGGNITAGQGTPNITVDWLGAGDGQLCVTASSSLCSVDRTACKLLTIKLLPPAPQYVSADAALCVGDTGVYVLETLPGVTSYNWVATGGQFIGNQTGSTVTIKWPDPVFTTMEVSANNSCGTGPITYDPTVLVSERPAMPGTLSGPTMACQGSTQIYSIAAVPGAETYVWTVPSGASILSGQGTVSIAVKFDALGTGNVCVKAKTGVCESMARCKSVTVGASVGVPGPVSGPASVCTSSQATYSVASVPGATGYVWTLPPGATFVGGNNTASVTVNFAGASSGQVCVAAVSSCGNSATSCLAVMVGVSLAPNISGATSFCTGGSTVLDAGAGYATYAWTGPNGFTANNQQATVNEPGIYTVTVSAAGGCSGTASAVVTVGASLNPVIAGPTAFCTGGSATLDAGSGYATYAWAGPNGFTANSQQPITDSPGAYTVTVSNASGCTGTDTHTLTANPLPTPTITGPTTVCSGNAVTLDAGAGYTTYGWSNAATAQTISATTAGIYAVTVTDGNSCTGTDTHTLTVNGLTPPTCQSTLTLPVPNSTNVPVTTALQWSATPGCVDGYRLSIGTTPGGTEILNAANVGNVTTYQPAAALPAGQQVYMRVVPYNGVGEASGCGEFGFVTAGGSGDIISPTITCPPFVTLNLPPGECDTMHTYTVTASDNFPGYTVTQLTGLSSGMAFPIGTTVNTFLCVDQAGNSATCSFSITVNEYPNAIQSLVCEDLVYVLMDQNCQGVVGADDMLEGGPYRCYDYYIVEVDKIAPFGNGPWLPAVFGPSDVEKTYQVRVTDPGSGVQCWGNVKIVDNNITTLVCEDVEVMCNATGLPNEAGAKFNRSFDFPSISILGVQTLSRPVNVALPVDAQVAGLTVRFVTNHVAVGDLDAFLVNPQGIQIKLFNRPGNGLCWGDSLNVVLDDTAALTSVDFVNTCNNGPAISGTFQPVDPIASLLNGAINGDWTILLTDHAAGDGGICNVALQFSLIGPVPFPNRLTENQNVFPNGTACYTVLAGTGTPVVEPCSAASLCYQDVEFPGNCTSGFTKTVVRTWTETDPTAILGLEACVSIYR